MSDTTTSTTMLRISWNGEWREIPLEETDVREIGEGHFLVTIENRHVEVFALPDGRLSDGMALDGTELTIETERERIIRERFQKAGPSGTVRSGTYVVKAPMPGLVRSIKVQQGDSVERAMTVVVLEAMKMENSILAGAKGRIKTVFATEGNSVEKNAPLLEIESA